MMTTPTRAMVVSGTAPRTPCMKGPTQVGSAGLLRSMYEAKQRGLPRLLITAMLTFTSLGLVGCTLGATGPLARLRAFHCPNVPPLEFIASDESATGRSAKLTDEREKIIQDLLTAVAACGGSARVQLFSSSATATKIVFDGDLKPEGATKNARLRQVPRLVEAAMKQIEAEWNKAVAGLPAGGTDVLSQLSLAQEYRIQLGRERPLAVVILSDGVQTTGVILNTPELTHAVATDLAGRVEVPNFGPSVHVTFAGLGNVAGPPPPTQFVVALKTFYTSACRRTGARCTVVTDFAGRGEW
jgi:hypothetical protein